jgi:hypothetical protein
VTECKFKVGDKIVCQRGGGPICAKVLKVHGNGFMDLSVFRPKLGTWEYVPPGGWKHITTHARCVKPPQID